MDIGTAVTTFKALLGAAKDAGNIPLQQQILDLQGEMRELIDQNTTLRQSNEALQRELTDLRSRDQQREAMSFISNVYWRQLHAGERDGPFCPNCLDGSNNAVRLLERSDDHWWRCPVCKETVQKPGPDPNFRAPDAFIDIVRG